MTGDWLVVSVAKDGEPVRAPIVIASFASEWMAETSARLRSKMPMGESDAAICVMSRAEYQRALEPVQGMI